MKKKPYTVHCAIIRDSEDNVHFGYAQTARAAREFYKVFSSQVVLDFNNYGGSFLDECYIMLHCELATDSLTQEDKEDILATTAFYIMQTIMLPDEIYEDKNCRFDGMIVIKA